MKKILLFLSVLFPAITVAQFHIWERTNPGGGGAFTCIGAGIDGTLLVGSDLSGAYMSTDYGRTWQVLGESRGLVETHVSAIGFSTNQAETFLIGTENGIFKTTDHGQNFYKVLDSGYVTSIAFATDNPQIVYAGVHQYYNSTVGRIYKSDDKGESWTALNGFPQGYRILKVTVDPNDANNVYVLTGMDRFACSPAKVFKSTDGGMSWTDITTDFSQQILDFALSAQNPPTLYITTMNAACDSPDYWYDLQGYLYKSTDTGNTWLQLSDYTGVIFLNPLDTNEITLIDPREPYPWNPRGGTFKSTDGGSTFVKTGFPDNWDTFFNGDVFWCYGTDFNAISKSLGTDLSDAGNIFWYTSQWAYLSSDTGRTFMNIFTDEVRPGFWHSRGLDNVDVTDISISRANPDIVFAAYFDIGLWRSLDRGESWQSCNPEDFTGSWEGFGGNCATVLTDPDRANVVWASMSQNQNGEYPTYLIKSIDTGAKNSWFEADSGLPKQQITGLSMDVNSPTDNRTLYVTADRDVYKSTDDGLSWTKVFDCNGCRFTAVDYFDGNVVYAGGENGLFLSRDGGQNWQRISFAEIPADTLQSFLDREYSGIFDIKTDPDNPGTVYITILGPDKGLYKSQDYGSSWQKLLTDDFMRKVAIVPANPDIIYATSSSAFQEGGYDPGSNGIWYSTDGGNSWIKQNIGMAWPFALAVDVDNTQHPMVFVGSPGTGFQKAQVVALMSNVQDQNKDLVVYPNPASNLLYITANFSKYSVFDSWGRNITKKTRVSNRTPRKITINVSALNPGVYILKIKNQRSLFIKL